MVVFYNKSDKNIREIIMVEHDVMSPTIPAKENMEGKINYYNTQDASFISLPYELGGDIFSYNLCFNDNGEFVGLAPIEKIN